MTTQPETTTETASTIKKYRRFVPGILGIVATLIATILLAHGGNWLVAHGYLSTGIAGTANVGLNIASVMVVAFLAYSTASGAYSWSIRP